MKNKNIISPIGLKGNQINERMKELMGISSINENKTNVVVELTKMGPDGKAYAIVRENHEYYIKSTNKTSGIVAEDFKYIGGLQNKKQEAYPSYAKAIKHLNLRFNSLSEAFNSEEKINTFLDDNLLSENGSVGGFQEYSNGFSNEGNMEGNTPIFEWEDGPNPEDEKDYDKEERDEDDAADYKIKNKKEDDLTETEQAVEDMLDESWMDEELTGNQDRIDMNHNNAIDSQDFDIMNGMDEEDEMGMKPTLKNYKSFPEFIEAIDEASAKEILASLYDELGAPVVKVAKHVVGFLGGPDVRDAINKRYPENEGSLYEGKLSINKAINQMDALIDGLTESKKKVKTQK